jgi:hypothetical protein
MKYFLLVLPVMAMGCASTYDRGTADYYYGQRPTYAYGYGYNEGAYSRPYYGGENCG